MTEIDEFGMLPNNNQNNIICQNENIESHSYSCSNISYSNSTNLD